MSAKSVKEEDEGELRQTKEGKEQRQRLHPVFKEPRVVLNRADVSEEYLHPEQEPEPAPIKEEEEPEPTNIKEEPKPPHVEEDPEAPHVKDKEEPRTFHIKDEKSPQPPHLKEEEQEVNIPCVIVKIDDDDDEDDGDHGAGWAPGAITANVKRKARDDSGTAKKRHAISMETKVAIITRLDNGEKVVNVSRLYKRNTSTICTIYKNKDRIMAEFKSSESGQSSSISSEQTEKLIGEMEKLLSAWIEHQRQTRAPLCLKLIKEKAKNIFEDLKVKAGEDAVHQTFSVSSGWFDQFKKSANLHRRVSVRGKAANAHRNATNKLPDTPSEIKDKDGDAGNRCSCSHCGKTFVNKYGLKKHLILHTGEKRFRCSDCGKRFTWKVHLITHARTHTGEKPFACSVCGKTFAQKGHVRTHMKIHTGEKPFACSVCNFSFGGRSGLAKHMKTHTGDKHFSCSVCDKKFLHGWALKTHARIHTGEKPFACSVCDKRFSAKTNLTRHTKIHNGKKPLMCSVCGKIFSTKTNLIMHTRTHTGEKELHTLFWVPILFSSTQT
ncbi:uncharacterized protein LOC144050185 [Vanacampus margaritifer]